MLTVFVSPSGTIFNDRDLVRHLSVIQTRLCGVFNLSISLRRTLNLPSSSHCITHAQSDSYTADCVRRRRNIETPAAPKALLTRSPSPVGNVPRIDIYHLTFWLNHTDSRDLANKCGSLISNKLRRML